MRFHVFSQFKTGNSAVDMVLFGFLMHLGDKVLNLINKCYDKYSNKINLTKPKNYMTIPEYEINQENVAFTNFVWYISNESPPETGHVNAYKRQKAKSTDFPVAAGCYSSCEWRGITFEYEFSEKEDKALGVGSRRSVTISSEDITLDTLKEFVQNLSSIKEKALESSKIWEQMAWTQYEDAWKCKLSHNRKLIDTIALDKNQLTDLKQDIELFLDSEDYYMSKGIPWNRGYLLHGPPGTGKTSLIKALSYTYRMDMYILNLRDVNSDQQLKALVNAVLPRSMLILEDIDSMSDIIKKRDQTIDDQDDADTRWSALTLSGVLNVLDGLISSHGRVLVMTSNHPELIDDAVLRPGRCDMKLELDYCSFKQMQEIFKIFLDKELPQEFSNLPKMSPAELVNICLQNRKTPKRALATLSSKTKKKIKY